MNLALCVLYRPGGVDGFSYALEEIRQYVNNRAPPLPNVMLLGDFNLPNICWISGSAVGPGRSRDETRAAELLCHHTDDLCLVQVVKKPTR